MEREMYGIAGVRSGCILLEKLIFTEMPYPIRKRDKFITQQAVINGTSDSTVDEHWTKYCDAP
jgi:hypothetical protein